MEIERSSLLETIQQIQRGAFIPADPCIVYHEKTKEISIKSGFFRWNHPYTIIARHFDFSMESFVRAIAEYFGMAEILTTTTGGQKRPCSEHCSDDVIQSVG